MICYVQNVLNAQDERVWKDFVDLAGRSALRLGLSRSLGQVYAAIFLSPRPLGLENLMGALRISKGNTSTSVRQLAEWGVIRAVWVQGDRRDYYEATEGFSSVLRHFLSVVLQPRLASTDAQLNKMESQIAPQNGRISAEGRFMKERIGRLKSFHRKLSKLVPLAEKFL